MLTDTGRSIGAELESTRADTGPCSCTVVTGVGTGQANDDTQVLSCNTIIYFNSVCYSVFYWLEQSILYLNIIVCLLATSLLSYDVP